MTQQETHEPDEPINWPHGHVGVDSPAADSDKAKRLRLEEVAVTITDDDADECMMITLGGHDHYLHSTTTRELSNMLLPYALADRPVSVTIHGVNHELNGKASRSLSDNLHRRLDEWNRDHGLPWLPRV